MTRILFSRSIILQSCVRLVYYIGKGANGIDHKCPTNARNGTTGNCECLEGYKATPDNRQCGR